MEVIKKRVNKFGTRSVKQISPKLLTLISPKMFTLISPRTIRINPELKEARIIIEAPVLDETISNIARQLTQADRSLLCGQKDGVVRILKEEELIRLYAQDKKVYAQSAIGLYVLKKPLYELEEQLDPTHFVRISSSEIINLNKVRNFDLSLSGTICVRLEPDITTYVSRRFVPKIRKKLGL